MILRTFRWLLIGWLLTALAGTLGLCLMTWADLRGTFDLDARVLHRVISQRMEQQEAVLRSVDALWQQHVDPMTLDRFTDALLAPYPQVIAVEQCAGTTCSNVLPGPFSLPAVPTLTPAQPTLLWPKEGGQRYALALRKVRVWIDAQRLLTEDDLPGQAFTMQISRPDGSLLVSRQQVIRPASLTFRVEKKLGTALQAFPIRFERAIPWTAWPWTSIAAWWVLTAAAAAWALRLLSARRRSERALQEERLRAQGILAAATDGIVALNPDGQVVQANPASQQVLGHLPAGTDIRGAVVFHGTLSQAPFDAPSFWINQAAQSLPEGIALRRGRTTVLIEGSIAPVFGMTGQLLGRVFTVREVGPLQRRMLAQLSEGERRVQEHAEQLAHVSRLSTLGEMSAGLAHELNQPLTAVVSYGQAGTRLLSEPDPDLARVRHAMSGMVAQAQRASEIIGHLRRLVRRTPARQQAVDLTQVVQNVLTLCDADLKRLSVMVTLDAPQPAPWVRADAVQIEQIVLNLLRNALDALSNVEDRRLTLKISHEARTWDLYIHDSGPGLTPEAERRLFTPFNTTKAEGLGLGLTLSQGLAQGMDGDLTFCPQPQRGAAFRLTLPVWEVQHEQPA
ncbi:ATP-binding protein [Deinococcus hohokamensis]|uniref:histidine kinase n=1 Tax=Deinococcus hohokamensis TaxID=309883 RepID=A0ABV9ICS1_9DEIO